LLLLLLNHHPPSPYKCHHLPSRSEPSRPPQPTTSKGARTPLPPPPRGIYHRFGSESGFALAAATVLGYTFRDEDLLEEALESVGSGVLVVGASRRVCEAGNRELGVVGEAVMGLVLRDQCYLFRIPQGECPFL
jgi:hypothetical protein